MIHDRDRQIHGARRFQRLNRRRAAIQRDDKLRALVFEMRQGGRVGAIAFFNPVGHIDERRFRHRAQPGMQLGGRAGAVDIIVGEQRDFRAALDRVPDQRGRVIHAGEAGRVGKAVTQAWVEKGAGGLGVQPARGEQPGERIGHAMATLDLARLRIVSRFQNPAAPAQRPSDAK